MNINKITEIFKDCELSGKKIIIKAGLSDIMSFIKTNYGFVMLKNITAVDNAENGIELIYRLYSPDDDENVVLSASVKDEAASISKIFDSAIADEKEIYDLFGITFIGNDELERLYLPESWRGHPLRKNYTENDERLAWNE